MVNGSSGGGGVASMVVMIAGKGVGGQGLQNVTV